MAAPQTTVSIKEIASKINYILDQHENDEVGDDDKPMIRAMISTIMRLLMDTNWSYSQAFPWSMVGVDPSNRYGDGLDPERVHKLILAIFSAGWCVEETSMAVAREVDGNDSDAIDSNVQLAIDACDMLPPVNPQTLKVLTLSCGHTTAGLGCFGHGVTVHLAPLQKLCHEGRLSLAKLRELQPAYAEAVDKGLTYRVIRAPVIRACPRLPMYVQEAYNTSQQTAQRESCFQVLLKIHSEARRMQKAGHPPDWKSIATKVGNTRPDHAPHCGGYAAFIGQHVDNDGMILKRLGQCLKSVPIKATVRGSIFQALADQPLVGASEYVEAAALLMYDPGKASYVKNGVSTIFASCDFAQLSNKLSNAALQVAKLLRELRAALESADVPDRVVNMKIGDVGKQLVMHVHAKSKDYPDLEACQWACWNKLKAELIDTDASDLKVPKSWGKEPKRDKTPAPPDATGTMQVPRSDGSVDTAAQLARLGFKVGGSVAVKHPQGVKVTPETLEITAITKHHVAARGALPTSRIELEHAVFVRQYVCITVCATVRIPIGDLTNTASWKAEHHNMMARLVLEQAWRETLPFLRGRLVCEVKPHKRLIATADFDTGAMILVPLASSVRFTSTEPEFGVSKPLFKSFSYNVDDKHFFCVIAGRAPTDGDTGSVPYFCIRPSADIADVNTASSAHRVTFNKVSYEVPVLVNVRPIKRGEELKIYAKPMTADQLRLPPDVLRAATESAATTAPSAPVPKVGAMAASAATPSPIVAKHAAKRPALADAASAPAPKKKTTR